MTPRKWYAIATMMMMVAIAGFSQAGDLGRIVNGDCEQAGGDGAAGWQADRNAEFTGRADAVGADGSAACFVVGPRVLRSDDLFAVTAGEQLTLSADVFEVSDNTQDQILGADRTTSASVVALEFRDVAGKSVYQLEVHCDEYVDSLDGAVDGSDFCDATTGFRNLVVPAAASSILKYQLPIVVPSGALYAQVLLGGSVQWTSIGDPLLFGAVLNTPTTVTLFDNIALDTL